MKIYFDGCSWTKGEELENQEEERYSKLICDKLGAEETNLGMGGGSNDRIVRNLVVENDIKNYDLAQKNGVTKIICIAVNDPNVMKAWGENQNAGSKIFMVGDPFLNFTKSIGAEVDKSEKGLGVRSNRYTMLIENELLIKVEEEKETATCELSGAENFLKSI